MNCPICEKRKAPRYCPAKGERICAVCCGREREVSIDCPADCGYLLAAHRYEDQHQRDLPADTPLLDAKIPRDAIYEHQSFLAGLAFAVAKFTAAHPETSDADVLKAVEALAETHKTLSSGILYEKPPAALLSRELYGALAAFVADARRKSPGDGEAQTTSPVSVGAPATIKDSEIFALLVFLYRMGLLRTNGRPRARRFVEFLRGQFPGAPELKREESRIIVP
ncbi:MAG TPA: hypothetical protein VJN42_00740 [Candidatus Acidoferrum sp.]|nr:hypothetical protein [Candidatus Acidoferrum sp.]